MSLIQSVSELSSKVVDLTVKLTSSLVQKLEKVDVQKWSERRQKHQLAILSGISAAVSLTLICYLSRPSTRGQGQLDKEECRDSGTNKIKDSPTKDEEVQYKSKLVGPEIVFEQGAINAPNKNQDVVTNGSLSKAVADDSTPDTSFETETDASVMGDVTLATIDVESAQDRVLECERRGKALARKRQYSAAASVFSEAISLLQPTSGDGNGNGSNLVVSLLDKRSQMYEKEGRLDLALEDCEQLLRVNSFNNKAKRRQTRLLKIVRAGSKTVSQRPSFLRNLTLRRSKQPASP